MSSNKIILPGIFTGLLFFLLSRRAAKDEQPNKAAAISPGAALDYIRTYYPAAKRTEQLYSVPALFTLAQAGLESGWGTSNISRSANNHFGIKADKSWRGPTYGGTWRAYSDPSESYQDHAKFLVSNPRYSAAFSTSDPAAFTQAVAAAGYAGTDPDYSGRILRTMQHILNIVS
jgi:flagellar protein FlgJ